MPFPYPKILVGKRHCRLLCGLRITTRRNRVFSHVSGFHQISRKNPVSGHSHISPQAIIKQQRKLTDSMSTIEQIEAAILKLPPGDYQKLVQWLLDIEYQRWSEQLEQDILGGKLDTLAEEALADFESGQYRVI